MRKKYRKQENVVPKVFLVNQACCDCGLVHKMGFTVGPDAVLRLEYSRVNRATAQLRRGNFPYLKNPIKGERWKMVRVERTGR